MKTEKQESFLTMLDVQEGRCHASDLVRQLTVEEMTLLCVNSQRRTGRILYHCPESTACPRAGYDIELLETRGVRNIILASVPQRLSQDLSWIMNKK